MKLSILLAAALVLIPVAAGAAPRHRHVHKSHARVRAHHRPKHVRPLPRVRMGSDEVELSASLTRAMQRNLVDGGYLKGTIDGRLTERTRLALAAFQREYHLAPTGLVDRATADALLGRETVGSFLATRD